MKTTIRLMLAAAAILLLAPSVSAMQFVGPEKPSTECPVTEPGDGGLEGQVKDAAHLATSTACGFAGDAYRETMETYGIGHTFVMTEVDIVMTVIGPVVDGTQENVCDTVYGPDHTDDDLGCSEIIVDLRFTF